MYLRLTASEIMSDSNDHPNLLDLDDTFDADESLLVSPTPKSTVSTLNKSMDDSFNVGDGLEHSFQNSPVNKANESMFSTDSSFNQTPSKPRFSYANAMDALDYIMPSAMKTKRRATMYSFEHSSAKKMSDAAERLSGGLNESFDYSTLGDNDASFVAESCNFGLAAELEKGADESLGVSVDQQNDRFEQESKEGPGAAELDDSLVKHHCDCNEENEDITHLNLTAADKEVENESPVKSDNYDQELLSSFERGTVHPTQAEDEVNNANSTDNEELESCNESPPTIELDNMQNNYNSAYGTSGSTDDQPSAFRYPCIRQDNIDEEGLELKLGCPVNYSFDGNMPEKVDAKASIDVEHGVTGTSLDDADRVDPIDACIDESEHLSDVSNEQHDAIGACEREENNQLLHEDSTAVNESNEQYENIFESSTETETGDPDQFNCENVQDSLSLADESRVLDESTDVYAKAIRNLESNSPSDEFDLPSDFVSAAEYETALCRSDDAQTNHPAVQTEFEEHTPPVWNALSPIAKSSSPHNCDDHLQQSDQLVLEKKALSSAESEGAAIVGECKAILSSSDAAPTVERDSHLQPTQHTHQGTIFDTLSESFDDTIDFSHLDHANSASSSIERHDESMTDNNFNANGCESQPVSCPVASQSDTESAAENSNRESSGDFQDTFNSTTNALLQRLRASAETRKREVTRCRYSLERKEQIMMGEKQVRDSLPTVEETLPDSPRRRESMLVKPVKKIEGLNPYKPFVARPAPSAAVKPDKLRRNSTSTNAYKPPATLPARKKLEPHDDPYKPFKARPMPSSTSQPTPSIGTKRKSSAALRPHPEQNKSSVKPAALNAKPPTRLLSGRDASMAREHSLRERIEKENDKARKQSVFKARPLPSSSTALPTRLIGEGLLTASGKENEASTSKRLSSIQPFTPHSSRRARQRADFDSQRAEREKTERIERSKKRQSMIEQAKKEADMLKNFIR